MCPCLHNSLQYTELLFDCYELVKKNFIVHLLSFNQPVLKYPPVTEEELRLYGKTLLNYMICLCSYDDVDFFVS